MQVGAPSRWEAGDSEARLLVPMDGSPASAGALATALAFARAAGAGVSALYVAKRGLLTRRSLVAARSLEEFGERHPEEEDEAKLALLPARVWGKSAGVGVEVLAARGDAAEAIAAAAQSRKAALIVMGSHGTSGRSPGKGLGSVARAVFLQSAVPVVVIPPGAVRDLEALARDVGRQGEALPIGPKIIAALDAGPGSREVAAEAVELARRTRGSVRLFSGAPLWPGAELGPVLAAAQKAAEAAGVPFKVDTGAPDALEGLVALSREQPEPLVIVGTRGATPAGGDHLGSFTDRLLARAGCAVEVLRLSR
jgi:nucleotide-binding universal stress UspA family protein